jgi:hypothetical protein
MSDEKNAARIAPEDDLQLVRVDGDSFDNSPEELTIIGLQREVALLARLAQRPFANGRMASESAAVVMERARRRWARDTRNRA